MSLTSLTAEHTLSHYRRTFTRGAGGGRVSTRTAQSDKVCRIQPLNATERVVLLKDGMDVSAVMYFSSDPSVLVNDEFDYGTTTYQVKGVIDFDRLGRLWKVYVHVFTEET